MIYSPGGRALKMLLSSPDGWALTTHRIYHKQAKITMWIGAGWASFDGYEETPPFLGVIERFFLHRKARQMINQMVAQKMYQGTIGA